MTNAAKPLTIDISYAVSIQPRTGQQLEEYPRGLTLTSVRRWTPDDTARFPQAEKAVTDSDWCLVVETTTDRVFMVSAEEFYNYLY